MPRFKLFIEYEGTRYRGWQYQKNVRTIQGQLMDAAAKVFRTQSFEIYGSGRTDAGVHALRQVAHLDVDTKLEPRAIRIGINDLLPSDIGILEVERAHPRFHARHSAVARSYLYQISKRRTAFGKRYVWWVKDELQVGRMERTARLFVGMKDFRSFTAADPEEQSTKVLIEDILIKETDTMILIRIFGSHFLWKMIRQMMGVIVEAGRGGMDPEEVERMFELKSDLPAKLTAPPSGLFLERVYYQGDTTDVPLDPVINLTKEI